MVILSGSAGTLADDLKSLQDQYAALQQQQQQLQQQMSSQKSQLATASQQKAAIDQSVQLTSQQINILNSQISTLDVQIAGNTNDIAATQKNIDDNYNLYKQRLRATYEAGKASYVDVLLSSKDFTDFISRAELLQVVSKHDTNLIDNLTQDETKLKTDQAAMQANKASLVNSQGTIAAKQDILNAQLAQQSQVVSDIKNNYNNTTQQYNDVGQQARQTDAEINAEIAREAAAERAKNPGMTASAADVISYAKGFLGVRYNFGSANPAYGFDCSGFTAYVFANVKGGICLTHSALEQSQYKPGITISNESDLAPGDLVFFATDGGRTVSHVGIYIGNGAFIGANSSTGVAIVNNFMSISYWRNDYLFGRRILN
jgi:cell wall-associated NlpC family hydrolase